MSSLGKWPSQRIVNRVILAFFCHLIFFDFGSQIYTSPPTFAWHTPPSRVLRRLLLLPPQALVVSIIGDRCVVPTHLGALCSLVHVRATLRLFQAVHDGNWLYDVGSLSGWYCDGAWPTRPAIWLLWPPSPTVSSLFFGVSACLCLCYSLVSPVTDCSCLIQIL
jgi:hypothetical protein